MSTESFTFHDKDLPIEQRGFIRALNLRRHLEGGGTREEVERLERDIAYFHTIERWVENPENYIDKGGAGNVYGFNKIRLCIKVMKNYRNDPNSEYFDIGNSALVEAMLMREVDGLEVSGVRAPTPVQAVMGEHVSAIIMERLNAVNLQHVLNGTESYPDTFNLERFVSGVSDYLDVLHTEKNIVHADLYPRNFMLNKETGAPYVIDFGRSKMTAALDRVAEEKLRRGDWARLEETLREVEEHAKTNFAQEVT
jgi:tRNA A-37 threonylcarbamoyl transferase component Bud32